MRIGRLTRKAVALGAGRGTVVLAQFAINLVLVRWWAPEEFGRFHQIRVILSLAAMLDLGLPVGLLQATGGMGREERNRFFHRGVSLAVALGLLVGCGFVGASLALGGHPLAAAMQVAALLIAATIPASALESVLVVRDEHVRASIIGAGAALAGLCASALVLLRHPTIEAVYFCLALAAVARFVALWAWSGIPGRIVRPWSLDIWPLVRTSLAASASRLLGMASASVDRAVVAFFFSAGTLGWYVTGAWELPFMSVASGAIVSAIVPEMSEHWAAGRRADFLAVWQEAARRAAWIVFPIWLWAWVWAPELLRVLFTAQYEEGLPVFRIYVLVLPLRVAIYAVLFLAMNRMRPLLYGSALDLVLNLLLSVALAELVGPLGPAIASAAATWLQTVFYLVVAGRLLAVPPHRLLPMGDLGRAIVVASLAVVPTLAIRTWIEGDIPRLLGALAVTTALAGALTAMDRLRPRRASDVRR